MTSQMLNETADQNLMFYHNRWNVLSTLGAFLLLAVCCVYGASIYRDWWTAGVFSVSAVVLFSLSCYLFLFYQFLSSPLLEVSEEGILQRAPFANLFVKWEEIAVITPGVRQGISLLCIYVSDSGWETFSLRRPWPWRINDLMGGDRNVIIFAGFLFFEQIPDIIAAIQERYQKQIEFYQIDVYSL